MRLRADYHSHSTYSDGRPLPAMIEAAAEAGLEAFGVTDHCNVSTREQPGRTKRELGFNLDATYERRREAIDSLRTRTDLTVYDAVELDYHPADETEIAAFLDEAAFDYAIGSVHELDETTIFDRSHFEPTTESDRRRLVDTYYDRVVSLIESELFDVVAHVDAIERTPSLRGLTTDVHYERVANALSAGETRTEINAGRAVGPDERFHPSPAFTEALAAYDARFVPGTDAHRPSEVPERVDALSERFAEYGLEPISPFE